MILCVHCDASVSIIRTPPYFSLVFMKFETLFYISLTEDLGIYMFDSTVKPV